MSDPKPHPAPSDARSPRRVAWIPQRGRTALAALAVGALVVAVAAVIHAGFSGRKPAGGAGTAATDADRPPTPTTTTLAGTGAPSTSAAVVSMAQAKARASVAALVAAGPVGGVSVAVRDLTTGRQYRAGAGRGMVEASVAKVQILETMLLQRAGPLTGGWDESAEDMIEHSANDAADDCFADLGGRDDFLDAEPELGLSTVDHGARPRLPVGPDHHERSGAVDAAGQLGRPGIATDRAGPPVRAGADAPRAGRPAVGRARGGRSWTVAANKNGWLAIDADDDLWAVNSDGIVTVHGHELLVSVMTQHNLDFATGTRRVSALLTPLVSSVLA